MSLDALLVHTVTIVHPGTTTDGYGDTVADWSGATEETSPARVTQRTATEDNNGRAATITEWRLLLPATATIAAADRVTWNGDTFEVVGDPVEAVRRSATVHHVEVTLRKVEG